MSRIHFLLRPGAESLILATMIGGDLEFSLPRTGDSTVAKVGVITDRLSRTSMRRWVGIADQSRLSPA